MGGYKQLGGEQGNEIEERINALAEALGMPPKALASAIAGAVKKYIPPATISSVPSKAEEKYLEGTAAARRLWECSWF